MKTENQNNFKKNPLFSSLLGKATPAKASGMAYTLATLIPAVLGFVFIFFVTVLNGVSENVTEQDWYLYCSYLLSPISFLVVIVWFLRYTETPVKKAVFAQKCHWKYFLLATLLQIGLLSLSELNSLFLEFLKRFGYEDPGISLPSMDGIGFVGVFLTVAILPALMEEIVFRGVLLQGLRSFGTVGATLVCGALFSLYHQNPAQTLYQFCCGAAFALVAIRSGSVLPSVLAHFINNGAILILVKLGIESYPTPVFIAIIIISVLSLIGSLAWLLFKEKGGADGLMDTKEENKNSERKRFFGCAAVGIIVCSLTWIAMLFSGI